MAAVIRWKKSKKCGVKKSKGELIYDCIILQQKPDGFRQLNLQLSESGLMELQRSPEHQILAYLPVSMN
jgi:hypothetical protein